MTEENRKRANELSDNIAGSEAALKKVRNMIADVCAGKELRVYTHNTQAQVVPPRFSEAFLRLVEQDHERLVAAWQREIEAL